MNDKEIVKDLIYKYGNNYFNTTGSILKMLPNALHFLKSLDYMEGMRNTRNVKNVHVIAPKRFKGNEDSFPHIKFYLVDNVTYVFCEVHNHIHSILGPIIQPKINPTAIVHPTTSLETEGTHLYYTPNGYKKQRKHISNVVIGAGSTIGAYTVIHRGVFQPTTIGKYVIIGSLVNIGHNCIVHDHSVITPGCVLAGKVIIGKNCWIGVNSSFKNGVEICDNVVIGQHSNVRHNINKPGIYAGLPLRKIGEYTENSILL